VSRPFRHERKSVILERRELFDRPGARGTTEYARFDVNIRR